MATTGSQFLLKILNGSQIGAEVALDAGEYSFGKGAEADLQFADLSLQDVHGRIRLRDGKLELRAESGTLTTSTGLEMAPGDTQWHEIAQLDSVTAGTTRFAVGSPGANWTELIGQTASGSATTPRRRNTGKSSGRFAMLGWPVAIGALSIAFLFASDMIDLGDGTSAVRNLVGEPDLTDPEKVAAALDALPFTDALTVVTAVDGRIGIEGYVGTLAERRAVQNALADTGVPVSRSIQVRDVLRNDVQGLLDSQQVDMNVDITPKGEAVLSGTMLDPDKARDIASLIGREVIGLSGVRNDLLTSETYLDRVEGLIGQAQLQDLVLLRLDGILIEATGLIPREKIDNWVGFIRAYSDDYADVIPLRSFVVLDDPENPGQPGQPILIGTSGFDPSGVARVLDPALLAQSQDIVIADLFANPSAPEEPAQDTPPEPDLDPATERLLALLEGEPGEIEAALGLPPGTIDVGLLATVRAGVASGAVDIEQLLAGVPQEVGERIQAILNGEDPPPETTAEPATEGTDAPPVIAASLPIDIFTFLNGGPIPTQPDTIAEDGVPSRADPAVTAPGEASDRLPGTAVAGDDARADDAPAADTDAPDALAEGVAPDPLGIATSGVAGFDSEFRNLVRVTGDFLGGRLPGLPAGDLPSLDVMSPRLVELARKEAESLPDGVSILSDPALEAERSGDLPNGLCWEGARVSVLQLPIVLTWLDIFSTNPSLDLSRVEGANRRLFFELALSPGRVRDCLNRLGGDSATTLLSDSVFLQETLRNESFALYLFRNAPRFALDVVGLNLGAQRFVALPDGQKLFEGQAPDISSRIAAIGELGILVRTASGYRVNLYGEQQLAWILE